MARARDLERHMGLGGASRAMGRRDRLNDASARSTRTRVLPSLPSRRAAAARASGSYPTPFCANTPTTESPGTISLSSWSNLPWCSWPGSEVSPVIFPPGRAKLWMKPWRTGSRGKDHDDRNGRSRLLRRDDRWIRSDDDHIHRNLNEFRCECRQPVHDAACPAILKGDIAAVDVAEFAHCLLEGLGHRHGALGCANAENTDSKALTLLLGVACERLKQPKRCHSIDEGAPIDHSITSLAPGRRAGCGELHAWTIQVERT